MKTHTLSPTSPLPRVGGSLMSFGLKVLALILLASSAHAAITGTVFRDFNGNGIKDSSSPAEPGVAGVVVTAYDSTGGSSGTATSAANGTYSITATGTAPYRVEFTLSTSAICATSGIEFSSGGGSNYGTSVQFAASGTAANVNFAVHNPSDFNQGTSGISAFIPCYVSGDPLPSGSASGAEAWFVGYPYTNSGTTVKPPQMIGGGIIGPTWGVAYSKQAGKVFTSALLKRHVGLGALGSGGIYMLTPTASSFTVNSFYDLDANGHRTRADGSAPAYGDGSSFSIAANNATVTYLGAIDSLTGKPSGLGVIGTNTQRGLVTNPVIPSYDPAAFDQVGKVGLGDIDISDDGKYLFVMNLYSRKVFRLELDSATNPTAVTNVTSFSFPTIACVNGEYRPWGLKFFRNKLYAGVVCSGENAGTAADLNASVYVLNNPTAAATFETTALINVPLNYDKVGDYRPWTNNSSSVTSTTYPTAILSDIEFTDEGNMVLGIMDRSGHQWGESNRKFLKTSTTSITLSTSGDVLLAGLNCSTGTYTLENNGSITSANGSVLTGSTNPDNTNQGPGGKEFFDDDSNVGDPHKETALGSLAILKGQSELFLAAYAQTNNSGDAGTFKVSTTNGTLLTSSVYQLYYRGNPDGVFAKANGLGDLEITSPEAPIEIGNRVWADTDGDGIQDAGEPAISGALVTLKNAAGTTISSATTDTNGNYFFTNGSGTSTQSTQYGVTGLSVNTAGYQLCISKTDAALGGKSATAANADSTANGDERDSDGVNSGANVVITFATGAAGANIHSYDFGFTTSVICSITDLAFTGGTSTCNDNGTAANTADDYFTSDVTVTFANKPASGNLVLSGASLHSANTVTTAAVSSISSTTTYTFTGVKLKANNTANALTATFSADTSCTFTKDTAAVPPCSTAPAGCAPDLSITSIEFGPGIAPSGETVTLNAGTSTLPESNVAGFHIDGSSEGNFYTFCTEISQPILPLSNPYSHIANGSTNGYSAATALRIAQVLQAAGFNSISGFGAGNNTVVNFVALQMGVWNALYDTDYTVTAGPFQQLTDANGARAQANTWLTAAQAITAPTVIVHNLHSAAGQDIVLMGNVPGRITDIAMTGGTATCNDNGTSAVTTDDYFTSDVTVTFTTKPASGNLVLSGTALHTSNTVTTVAIGSTTSSTSHTFTGVRLKADNGTNTLTVAFDSETACAYSEVTLAVPPCSNPACPTITVTPGPLASGTVGTAYTASPSASGGVTPYVWTATALPAGLTINASTGAITGTPTATGNATITATDANNCTGTTTLVINPFACPVITVTPAALPGGSSGVAYNQTPTASGAPSGSTYTWSATSLPAGLSINATTGAITGTPTAIGTATITATYTSAGTNCTGTTTLVVTGTECCPQIFTSIQ